MLIIDELASHGDRHLGHSSHHTQVPVFYLCTQESELVQV